MNLFQIIVDVVMVLIIALLVILGIKRGLVKSFFRSTKIIFVILVTVLIGSLVVSLCQTLFVERMFEGKISDRLAEKAEATEGSIDFDTLKREIPAFVRNMLPMDEIEQNYENSSGDSVEKARAIGERIEEAIASVVSNIIGYVLAFILSFIICSIAILILEKIFELPVLGWLNRIGGVLWGLANAYIWVSLAVCIVVLIFGNEFIEGTILSKYIYYFGLFTF